MNSTQRKALHKQEDSHYEKENGYGRACSLFLRGSCGFIIACLFVVTYGYNRIHMTNHFLSDVCFGTLITYTIYTVVSTAFLKAAEK